VILKDLVLPNRIGLHYRRYPPVSSSCSFVDLNLFDNVVYAVCGLKKVTPPVSSEFLICFVMPCKFCKILSCKEDVLQNH
jgi:hypothetical protein